MQESLSLKSVAVGDLEHELVLTLQHRERVLSSRPKASALRENGISHMIHHRGQLTVYLRLLDVPLPPLYGPTADEGVAFGRSGRS